MRKIETHTTTTTEGPLNSIFTNTAKWKQNRIILFQQFYNVEFDVDYISIYIDDDDDTIYIPNKREHRVIGLKLTAKNFSVVAGGNVKGTNTNQLSDPLDVIVDKKTNSIIICEGSNQRIVRWFRHNTINGEIIIPNIDCIGLAMDDKGYLYISNWKIWEVRRWEIGVNTKSIIVADGNNYGDGFEQFGMPMFISVDKNYSVYVADKDNHRVMKWIKDSRKGIVVAGGNGDGAYLVQLSRPTGVVVDHLGNVYVADTFNNRIMRWLNGDTAGTVIVGGNMIANETNQLRNPTDLLFDKRGNLYVVDSDNYRLQRFDIELN